MLGAGGVPTQIIFVLSAAREDADMIHPARSIMGGNYILYDSIGEQKERQERQEPMNIPGGLDSAPTRHSRNTGASSVRAVFPVS